MLLSVAQLLLSTALIQVANCYPRLAARTTVFSNSTELKTEYDYVIIGGGTSGLTVANRLTEDDKSESGRITCLFIRTYTDYLFSSTVTVLVIEYGDVYDLSIRPQITIKSAKI